MLNPHINQSVLSISASLPATYDAAGYGALTFTRIKGVRATGRIGEKYETRDSNEIDAIRANEVVGLLPNSFPLEVIKFSDAGQDLLKAAFAAAENGVSYSYKFQVADGTIYYFTAQCSERTHNGGEAKTIADFSLVLEINSRLLEI